MKALAKAGACAALVGAIVIGGAVAANAHGLVGNGLDGNPNGPSQLTARAAFPANAGIGQIAGDVQSLEGPKGFTLDPATGGPADGRLGSAGHDKWKFLDEQSPERWVEQKLTVGQTVKLAWHYTAAHRTSQWRYYITKNDWDQNSPLTRADLELLTTIDWDGSQPTSGAPHSVKLPADRTGDHVILAVWDVADTTNAFYNLIDVHIDGEGQPEKPDTAAPTAPSDVRATNVTDKSATISWKASTDDVAVDSYEIRRSTKGGASDIVGTVRGTSFTNSGLTPSTAYDYQVIAIDAAGNRSAPGVLSLTTKDEAVAPGPDTEAPSAPSGLHKMGVTANSVSLMWTDSVDNVGVKEYSVERAVKGGQFQKVGSATKNSFLDKGLTASTAYEYRIVAVDAAGNVSAPSAVLSVTTAASTGVKEWDPKGAYKRGDRVTHLGATYEALQDYPGDGNPDWINAPSLWKKLG